MRRRAPRARRRSALAVAGVAVALLAAPARAHAADPVAPASPAPTDAAASNEAQGAAALQAAQDVEVRVLELRRELDAMERERASYDDLRRRLDVLEARQAASRPGVLGDWESVEDRGDGLRFSQGGYAIRSPDNRFLLRPGLRLQGIYEGDLATAGFDDPARPDSSAFRLAHAELLFEGHAIDPRFEFRLELDFADTTPGIAKDAFVQWRFLRAFAIRVGQLKVPYGLQAQYWNADLELVDVAAATAAFTLDRGVGVMLVGRPLGGRLQVQAAATNGPRGPCPVSVDGLGCDEVDLAYAARVVAAPFGPLPPVEGDLEGQRQPLLSVGLSGAYLLLPTDVRARTGVPTAPLDVDGNGRIDNVGVWQGGVELRAMFRGASLQGEWFGRREHAGAGAADRSYVGAYSQAGYFVVAHKLQLLARVDRTDLPLYGATAAERLVRGSRTTEETGGLSFYLRGHNAKLQVDYTHITTPDAGSAPTIHRARAALQMSF